MEDSLDWIKDTNPSLYKTVIRFEPMLDSHEFDNILVHGMMHHIDSFGENIRWASGRDFFARNLSDFEMVYLHHIIIDDRGMAYYGGIDEQTYQILIDEDLTDENIRTDYDFNNNDIKYFLLEFKNGYIDIDGRQYFDIPCVGAISEDFLSDFGGIEIYPKLGDIWSEKLLSVGDVLILSGMVMPARTSYGGHFFDSFKVVINNVDFNDFESCFFTVLDVEDRDKLAEVMRVTTLDDINFINEDKDLDVIEITKKDNLNESDDFNWVGYGSSFDGVNFILRRSDGTTYTIKDDGSDDLEVFWPTENGYSSITYKRQHVIDLFLSGDWLLVDNDI